MSKLSDFQLKSFLLDNLPDSRSLTLDSMVQFIFEDENGELPFQNQNEYSVGVYNAMLTPLIRDKNNKYATSTGFIPNKTIIVHKDLENLNNIVNNRAYILPVVTFAGNKKTNKNARNIYSIVVDLDDVSPTHLSNLINLIEDNRLPKPNIIVNSGNGLHLYFNLDSPVPLYNNYTDIIQKLKTGILDLFWQPGITTKSPKNKQLPLAITQGYRTINSKTKSGETVQGWILSEEKYSLYSLNNYINNPTLKLSYNEINILLGNSKEIENNINSKRFYCHRGFYDKAISLLLEKEDYIIGKRYNALRGLVIIAKKCNISLEELRYDLDVLRRHIIKLTNRESFSEEVIEDAIQNYFSEDAIKIKRETINNLTGLNFSKAKRNGLSRAEHLEIARKAPRSKRTEKGRKEYKERDKKQTDLNKEILKLKKRRKSLSNEEISNELNCSLSTVKRVLKNRFSKKELLFIKAVKFIIKHNYIPKQNQFIKYSKFSKGMVSKYWNELSSFMNKIIKEENFHFLENFINFYNEFSNIFKNHENIYSKEVLKYDYYDT